MALGKITKGIVRGAWSTLIYGSGGIGKSTWAAGAPGPLFLQCGEVGANNLDVARVPLCETWEDLVGYVDQVIAGKGTIDGYKVESLVVDTVDGAEKLAWDFLCRTQKTEKGSTAKSIEDFAYKAGYKAVLNPWRSLLAKLQTVMDHGINVVLVGHERVQKFNNPAGSDYDRFLPDLHPDLAALLKNWVHCCLFAYEDVAITEKKGARGKATASGVRWVHTVEGAAYVAKNRYAFPDPLPLEFKAFEEALPSASEKRREEEATELADEIVVAAGTKYAAQAAQVLAQCKGDPRKLEVSLNRLRARLAADAELEATQNEGKEVTQ